MERIDELSSKLYSEVLDQYNSQGELNRKALSELLDEKLKNYNESTQKVLEDLIYAELASSIAAPVIESIVPTKLQLSKMLYKNSDRVARESLELLHQGMKSQSTIVSMSRKLYDGYDYNDKEVLDVKKKLPKYLQRELKRDSVSKEFLKYVDNIKTKPLKTALKGIEDKLGDVNKIGLQKALKVALEEKARYYATRIADTESHRARNLSRANEYLNDEELEYVKLQMSQSHKFTDICDYHAELDVGYGAGIVPKERMIMLPLHPHCHCRYIGHYSKVNKIIVKNPQLSTMQKFSLNEQRQIVGSHAKLQEFHNGEDITKLFNRIRPDYPLGYYRDVFGYNGGMKKFDKSNITHIEKSVIKEWTEDSTNIKMTMWGITKTHTHQANTLFELFYKYNPNIKKNSTLYRGMSFNKKDFISYGYGDISKGDLHSPDSMAIVSFSSDKREAFKYADFNKTNTYNLKTKWMLST